MSRRAATAFVLLGLAATAAAALLRSMPLRDSLILAGIAAGTALAVGVVGSVLLRIFGQASFAVQAAAVALISVAAVGVGAIAAGSAMFLSTHDLDALWVVLVAAGAVGIGSALRLSAQVGRANAALGAAARRIGAGTEPDTQGRPTIREFRTLANELERTAARLEEARAREQAVEEARRELVSWVSHDLRTPLAGMRALIEALEDGVVTDPVAIAAYHRAILEEVDRLARLTDDLFALSRIHAGLHLHCERLPLDEVVEDALAAIAPLARAKEIRLDGHLDAPGVTVDVAPTEFVRALRNLLANAVRETPEGAAVTVETATRDGHASVAVRDACGGIPEEDLPMLFETAFRGQRARTPEQAAGSGLGLAITRGLVEAHGGAIAVRNTEEGCCFTVDLPLPPAVQRRPQDSGAVPAAPAPPEDARPPSAP